MDPFVYLENDHKKVAGYLKDLEDTTERAVKTREQIFTDLDAALSRHADIEENILYPVLEDVKTTHDITLESFEEHHVIKTLLKELSTIPEGSEQWTAKLTVLKENVKHHVKEEESTMFPKARKALTDEQKEQLWTKMAETISRKTKHR